MKREMTLIVKPVGRGNWRAIPISLETEFPDAFLVGMKLRLEGEKKLLRIVEVRGEQR